MSSPAPTSGGGDRLRATSLRERGAFGLGLGVLLSGSLAAPLLLDGVTASLLGVVFVAGAILLGVTSGGRWARGGPAANAAGGSAVDGELHRSEQELRLLFEVMPVPVLVCDETGTIRYANLAASVSFDEEVLEGTDVRLRLPTELHERLGTAGAPTQLGASYELVRGSGARFPAEVAFARVSFSEGPAFLVIVHDVSAQQREHTFALERQREDSLREIAVAVAHDANNALASLRASAEVLREELALGEGGVDLAPLGDVLQAADRLAGMADALNVYSGTAHQEPVELDLGASARSLAESRGVSFAGEVEGASVWLDRRYGERMLEHLLQNALEATGCDSSRVRLSIAVVDAPDITRASPRFGVVDPAARYVRLEVRDEGVGMTADVLRRACDPLFSTKPGRPGFGLASVVGIVRAARGAMTLASAPGEGSAVAVYLPLHHARPSRLAPRPLSRPAPARGAILLVDDDPLVLRATARLLAREGYDVCTAAGGEEALECLSETPTIGLVVLDMRMPGMDGATLLGLIRARRPELPALLVSGQTNVETSALLAEFEGTRFLAKPFRAEVLRAEVRALLRERPVRAPSLEAALESAG